jgi:hypothetical protein
VSTANFSASSQAPSSSTSILDSYFTVYQTEQAIELHPGCEDYEHHRVICTCLYYEQACEIARLSGNLHRLPVKNFCIAL